MADADLLENQDEEAGSGQAQVRDWRGITTAILVIMAICTLIFLAGYIFTPLDAEDLGKVPLNMSELPHLRSYVSSVKWSNNDIYYETTNGSFEILDLATGKSNKIIDRETMSAPSKQSPSHDLQYYALFNQAPNPTLNPDTKTVFTTIINVKTHDTYKVAAFPLSPEGQSLAVFEWGPKENDYVFVQNNSIYYAESVVNPETVRVSKPSGEHSAHGIFDWVYDEEIFGDRKAMWWSPSGSRLAFASRDNKIIDTIVMTSYDASSNYPLSSNLSYPKTGAKNLPTYTLSIWDKKNGNLSQMDVGHRESLEFHYLFAVSWVVLGGNETLVAVWANRYQNQISVTLCEFDTAHCAVVSESKYPERTWALPDDYSKIVHSNDALFVLMPSKQKKDKNTYQHIARLRIEKDSNSSTRWSKPQFLSIGLFDVKEIVRYDKKTDMIYFTAGAPTPGQFHLYATKATPTKDAGAELWHCVSCFESTNNQPEANCTYQTTSLSPDLDTLLITCKGPQMPRIYVAALSADKDGRVRMTKLTEILHDSEMEKHWKNALLPKIIDDTVALANGYEARVQLVLPADQSTKTHTRSLPVLVKVYGGPGSIMVDDSYALGFEEYLTSAKHVAIIKVDGRGSGNRGWNYRSPIYGSLGTVEMEDQVEAIRQVLRKYPYLDASRVAVFGWSYGGYAAAAMVEHASEAFFKCAVSVAPVSNFQFYDATYTERYMGNASKEAYTIGDISRDVTKFKSTKLLLMHGLSDDNVHFQNSAVFIEKLQREMIDFDLMVYPNQDHGIYIKRTYLFTKIESFLAKCFST